MNLFPLLPCLKSAKTCIATITNKVSYVTRMVVVVVPGFSTGHLAHHQVESLFHRTCPFFAGHNIYDASRRSLEALRSHSYQKANQLQVLGGCRSTAGFIEKTELLRGLKSWMSFLRWLELPQFLPDFTCAMVRALIVFEVYTGCAGLSPVFGMFADRDGAAFDTPLWHACGPADAGPEQKRILGS